MRRRRRRALTLAVIAGIVAIAALAGTLGAGLAGDGPGYVRFKSKFAGGDPDAVRQQVRRPRRPRAKARSAAGRPTRPPSERNPADNDLAADRREGPGDVREDRAGREFTGKQPLGTVRAAGASAPQPGVTAFSGATNNTASRTTGAAGLADLQPGNCRALGRRRPAAASGGRTTRRRPTRLEVARARALDAELGRHARGRPDRPAGNTLYLGHRRGQPLLVRLRGRRRHLQVDQRRRQVDEARRRCVNNATYTCVDARPGRVPRPRHHAIVVDPSNANHIFVGSAQAVRGLSHVIGAGGTARLEPGANAPGLYESTDGGTPSRGLERATTIDRSFGVTDVGLDPSTPGVVYAAAFDAGLWRRRRRSTARRPRRSSSQVFAPQFTRAAATDRHDVRPDREEREDADLPDRGHRQRRRHPERRPPTSGGRTTRTSRPRRCSRRRRPASTAPAGDGTRSRRPTTAGSA